MNRFAYLLLSALFFYTYDLFAQSPGFVNNDTARYLYTDINKISLAKIIGYRNYELAYIDSKVQLEGNHADFDFKQPRRDFPGITIKKVTGKTLIRFNACNSADTGMFVWFFPGVYFWDIELYRLENGGLHKIKSERPLLGDSLGYQKLFLPPHDSVTIVAALTPVRTFLNRIHPRLITDAYLNSYIQQFNDLNSSANLVTYIFCGLLLMMILYSLSNYVLNGSMEFLFYAAYAFFMGLMMLIKAIYTLHTNRIAFFQEEYLDFILQCTGLLFYMIFMRQFLNTKSRHRFLYYLYNAGIALMTISMIVFSYLHYFTGNFSLENKIENYSKGILLLFTAIFIVYSITSWKDRLLRYLFWGNLCLFVFSLLSWLIIVSRFYNAPLIFRSSIFYYEVGLFLELVFFLAGLNHKNRVRLVADTREREKLKAENQKKEFEKELAVLKAQQEERERISADMHDELGSGMTAIRLMSEIARNKMKKDVPAEIEKISSSADEVLNKMNAMIWSMDSENDTVDNLVSYIRAYALEYFENTAVNCKVKMPDNIPSKDINGDKRRNVFLSVKETLNNTLKHAKASEVKIDFEINHALVIRIADNGTGINMDKIRQFGNGLKNIKKRMDSIGGSYHIENNNGTVTVLTLPL